MQEYAGFFPCSFNQKKYAQFELFSPQNQSKLANQTVLNHCDRLLVYRGKGRGQGAGAGVLLLLLLADTFIDPRTKHLVGNLSLGRNCESLLFSESMSGRGMTCNLLANCPSLASICTQQHRLQDRQEVNKVG